MIEIYTDGSSKGNPGPGGYAAIVVYDNKSQILKIKSQSWVTELGGREEHTTNNRMELTAVIESLKFVSKANEAKKLGSQEACIHTDSEYVMKGMTEWIDGWQKRGWKTAAKKPVLNQDLWQELLRVSEGKSVEWKYVRGHSGHDANERCDVIATTFADNDKPNLYNGPRSAYTVSL